MPKYKTTLFVTVASLLIAGSSLAGFRGWLVRAAGPADFMTGQLFIKLADTVGSSYHPPDDCQTNNVTIAGAAHEDMVCMYPTDFGWLDGRGVIRFKDSTVYRQIKLPPNIYLRPEPDSDTVFVVDQNLVTDRTVDLKYYEHFTDHLTVSPTDKQLVLDDHISSLTIATFDYSVPRQPDFVSSLNSGRILINYSGGRLGWADLNTKTSGVLQTLPCSHGAYMLPFLALSPDGRTVAVAYTPLSGYGPEYTVSLWDINNCAAAVGVCQRPILDYLQAQLPGLNAVGHMRFVGNSTLELLTGLDGSDRFPIYWLSTDRPSLGGYLAMGDSFASGEGAYSYLEGTDTATNKCHSSLIAYPYLLNRAAISVACSGAVTGDVNGQAPAQRTGRRDGDYNLEQLAQLQATALPGTLNQLDFASYFQPESVTVSIGGNDIGFANILKSCIDPRGNWQVRATCYSTYEDRLELLKLIRGQYDNLVSVYQRLLQPIRRLYVIGYPQIISDTGSCGVNVLLNGTERVFAVQLTDYLNSVIKAAADTAGAVYVDVSQALAGQRLCESSRPAVNGLTATDAFPFLGQESFHPNWLGHQLLALAISRQTNDLTTQPNHNVHQPPAITDDLPLLQVPKFNRVLNAIQYNGQLLEDVIKKGLSQAIHLLPGPEGFAPDSAVKLVLHSNPVTVGTYQTDTAGGLDIQFTLPAALSEGYHAVQLLGHNRYGETLEITKTVYITGDEPVALAGTLALGVASARAGLAAVSSQTAMTPSVVR